MVNKAVIIAAGMGSRLNGGGGNLPKPLVKVAGVGLLKRTILSAKRAGITDFVVVVGYRGEEIRQAISEDSQIDARIEWVENTEWKRGNGLSVLKARAYVDEPFLLMMSDHLFEPQVLAHLHVRYFLKMDPFIDPLGRNSEIVCQFLDSNSSNRMAAGVARSEVAVELNNAGSGLLRRAISVPFK